MDRHAGPIFASMPSTDPKVESLSRPIGTELAPTIEEYTALIQRPTPTTQGIFVPNPFTTVQGHLSSLLHIPTQDIHEELHQRWDQGIRIAWLSDWTFLRAMTPTTVSYQRDACHGFLLLVFGTLLFPYSPNLIDGAIAQIVLQAVGGHSYVDALLAETVRSLDYVREVRRGRMRGSPNLLQTWLLAHVRPFCSSHPFSYISDERSLIEHLAPVIPPPEHSFSELRRFWRELTPARFLWVTRWNPGGPMITGCPGIVGVSLLSHLGSTLIFPGRHTWLGSIHRDRHHRNGPRPPRLPELHPPSLPKPKAPSKRPCTRNYGPSGRNEIGSVASLLIPAQRHAPGVLGRPSYASPAPTSLGAPLARASQTPSASNDQARIMALEGMVNQMATSMAELLALLKGSNRTSSSSTPPPGPGPTANPTPWALPTQAPENMEAPIPPTLHTSVAHPFTSQFPPSPAPTAVPLPPATFLSSEHVLSAPPPVPITAPTMA
ncbi:hypothetical protein CRG98_021406 [Punica granatum]|uniref:DUF7745 domain-containing protein n=1 Tax=Punica granatum TaxID=22663 RepID=A0A2I0JPI4_PUNGR|nr:hypothetical protein CRG98_021406 [Punica granatum]